MSNVIRRKILEILKAHDDSGSAQYYSDKKLAEELGMSVKEVQDQLEILEGQGLMEVDKVMGPEYSAMINHRGKLYLEED